MYQRSSLQGQDKPKRPKRAVIPSRTAFISKKREKSREKEEIKSDRYDRFSLNYPVKK